MKVLIFMDKTKLAPTGGPVGYCYNIKEYIDCYGSDVEIHFLNESEESKPASNKKGLKAILLKFLNKHARWFMNYRFYNGIINKNQHAVKIDDINSYDFIHFHTTLDLYRERKELDGYTGKVIITSHSPIPSHMEIESDVLSKGEKKVFKKLYHNLSQIDEYAFKRADYIFFPCKEAEESYGEKWPKYLEMSNELQDKKRYILSGINACSYKHDRQAIRSQLNIPQDAFVVNYVGRHNTTKGYDLLKEMGEKLLVDDNKYVVVCGKESPLTRLQNAHWIEIGWTTDAHSYTNASDVFVLPNRDTYFDLIFLEVLSLGKIIVASRTGGNKIFKGKSNGIFLYDTTDEAIDIINNIKKLSSEKKESLERENKALFEKEFTTRVFVENYTKLLKELKSSAK